MDKELQDLEASLGTLRPRGLSVHGEQACHQVLDDLANGRTDVVPFPQAKASSAEEKANVNWSWRAMAAACVTLIGLGAGGGYSLAQLSKPQAPVAVEQEVVELPLEELASALEVDVESMKEAYATLKEEKRAEEQE